MSTSDTHSYLVCLPSRSRTWAPVVAVALSLVLLTSITRFAPIAHAYDGGAAARYADLYATNPNTNNYPYFPSCDGGNDCSNFVSQSLHAGGFSFVNVSSDWQDDHNWYMNSDWINFPCHYAWSRSWTTTPDLYTFLMWDYPGGWDWGNVAGHGTGSYSGLDTGDVLFFNWGNGDGMSHAVIQVGTGWDSQHPGWYGNLVDEHTSNRWHVFWSLEPENAQAATTFITLVHIDPNNH